MEMLLYLFGNWCVNCAACMLIYHHNTMRRKVWEKEREQLMVARDLQIMLFIGTVLRVYWSLSPPAVYAEEPDFIQWISWLDVMISPILWFIVLTTIGLRQKKYTKAPWYLGWPFLTFLAATFGMIGSNFLPMLETDMSWPYADSIVVTNMVIDGLAMIPQMYFIAYSDHTEKLTPGSSHFVGLLCFGRLLRMSFWMYILFNLYTSENESGDYLWTFIVPDFMHTFIMADYLYVWMQKVKRDQYDPFVNGIAAELLSTSIARVYDVSNFEQQKP